MPVQKLSGLLSFLLIAAIVRPAFAQSNNMVLVDIGRKDAVILDLGSLKKTDNGLRQFWSYTIYANPQIDGNEYYLTMYQLYQFNCTDDKFRNIEGHTYDLNDKETGSSYVNQNSSMQNVVPGSVSQQMGRIVCNGVSSSDTVLTNGLPAARHNYYQMLHDNKIQ